MPSILDRRQGASFAPGELAAPAGGAAPHVGDAPSTGGHPVAISGDAGGLGFGPYIPPDQQMAWFDKMQKALGGLTYSLPGGGYLTTEEANNANSYYNKFGGSDPAANKQASDFYSEVGALPTGPNLTPSAQLLANQTPGYTPQLGPSLNERLGQPWQGPWNVDPNRKPEHVGFTGPGAN